MTRCSNLHFSVLCIRLWLTVTHYTIPYCCCSVVAVCDLPGATTSVWFGTVPFTLGASLVYLGCEVFPASLAFWPCPISGILMSMSTAIVSWVSSTMGVGLVGSILGEGISSKLTNLIVCVGSCSIPYGCCGALRLLRGLLQAWIDTPSLGGAMVFCDSIYFI
jgi:hypothetical protein